MHKKIAGRRLFVSLLVAVLAAVGVSACGSSNDANTLLRQTFSGSHSIKSGKLNFNLSVTPSGSKTLNGPISLTFGGPFVAASGGKLPQSDFTVSFSALGKSGAISIVSTGSAGYVTLSGTSYQLPAATFRRLEASFSKLTSSSGGGGGGGALAKLGINPLHWLTNPSVVGTDNVGGSQTTHIRAGINVNALLGDLNTFLQKASNLGTSRIPQGVSPAARQRIAAVVRNPVFDVWTGKSDKTLRKLSISLTVPTSGQISTLLGGLHSAGIGMTVEYDALNQPQAIAAPTAVQPFSGFQTKLRSLLQSVQGAVGGGSSSSGTTGGTSGSSGSTSAVQAYTQCIQSAAGNVTKMQSCAALLNGK